jgi:flagellar motor switch protein FliN
MQQAQQAAANKTVGGHERVMPMTFSGAEKPVGTGAKSTVLSRQGGNIPLEYVFDIPVTLVFEVGRVEITIRQLLEMNKGSYIELRNVLVDVIDIRIDDKTLAYGETVTMQGRYAIRFNELAELSSVEELENAG